MQQVHITWLLSTDDHPEIGHAFQSLEHASANLEPQHNSSSLQVEQFVPLSSLHKCFDLFSISEHPMEHCQSCS